MVDSLASPLVPAPDMTPGTRLPPEAAPNTVGAPPSLATPFGSFPETHPRTIDEDLMLASSLPSAGDIIGAAFRQGNTLVSGYKYFQNVGGRSGAVDPDFHLGESLKAEKDPIYLANSHAFDSVYNQRDYEAAKAQIDMEEHDRRTVASGGFFGLVAGVGAGALDPTFLLPGLGQINEARSAASIAKGALRTGASFGAITAAQELGLQATQETRTAEESAMAIGMGTLLGGFLGGGIKALSPAERQAGEAALARLNTPEGSAIGMPGSGGAAARDVLSKEDLTPSGSAANKVIDTTAQLNPVLRGQTSPSAVVRETSQRLFENTIYQAGNDVGRTPGIAAETSIMGKMESRMAQGLDAHDTIWNDAKMNNARMSAAEFEEAVGRAMRRNDTGENDFVTRAAQAWRQHVFEPFKKEAIEMGLLKPDVSVEEADSYFSRLWAQEKLVAQETRAKGIFAAYFERGLREEFAGDVQRLDGRISRLDQEISDLKLSPSDRLKAVQDVEMQQQQLYGNAPGHVDLADQLSDLRQQVAAANERGDRKGAAALQEQARTLRQGGGDAFRKFETQRADLNARHRNLNLGYASMADRRDTIMGKLADLEEANQRSMLRLIQKGQRLQQELQRLDPEKFAARASQLREAFAAEAAKAERQAERFKAQIEKMKKAAAEGKNILDAGDELLARQAKAEQARADRLNSIAARLEAAESLDPQAMIDEVQDGVSDLIGEVSNVSLSRGERAQRLQDKLATLDPAKVEARLKAIEEVKAKYRQRHMEKWDIERGAEGTHLPVGQQDFRLYVGDIVDAIYDQLTGRNFDNSIPDGIVPANRGPMKERTFHIPDELVEEFLESNVKHVAEAYSRKMASDIEITRNFGSPDMKDALARVQQDYDGLRSSVSNAASVDEIRKVIGDPGIVTRLREKFKGEPPLEKAREEALRGLRKREKTDMEDLQAGRDLLRGNYKPANMNTVWGRSVRSGLQYNFTTRMGSVVISNVSEAMRPAMVYGMGAYLKDGVAPLLTNLKSIGVQGSIREAKLAGVAVERTLAHRIQTLAEIGDPYARGTAAERFLNNMARVASKWGGLAHWTDGMKSIVSVVAQDDLIRKALDGSDVRKLSWLGMNDAMRARVGDQLRKFHTNDDGALVANTEKWTDDEAIRHYRAALRKDVNSVIVTKSVGDVPLFANTPTGKILLQFKAFALASHQRVLIRGLQESATNFMVGMTSMTVMGMMATYLRAVATNRMDKLPGADNPGWWIGEGLDNTGIFAVPLELANDMEKPTGINLLKDPLRAAGRALTGATDKPESFRNTNRNGPGALLGPTFGAASDLFNVLGTLSAHGRGAKVEAAQDKSAITSAANLTPFYSYPLLRQIIDWGVKPAAINAVGAKQ